MNGRGDEARSAGRRPTLLILSFSDISADARVLKQVEHFSTSYEVTTCGYGPSPSSDVTHIEVPGDRVIWRYDRAALLLRRYRHAYWTNPAIEWTAGALSDMRFDVVLANDVDAVGLALSLHPAHGVHADLHEYAPRQKEELPRWRWFVAPFIAWMCRTFVAHAQSWTTVSGGLAREYLRVFGFDAQVVTNASPYLSLSPTPVGDPIRLVHSGACLRNRHLMTLIDGVEVASRAVTLDLYLTPNDPAYLAELRSRAAGVPGVRVHDPLPYSELVRALNGYDVGVFVLPPVNFNYEWALPNKLFDFVQARLAVLVGPSAEMAAYVREYGLGSITDDFSAAALGRAIDELDVDSVTGFKRRADASADSLSAEAQVAIWDRALAALTESRPG